MNANGPTQNQGKFQNPKYLQSTCLELSLLGVLKQAMLALNSIAILT